MALKLSSKVFGNSGDIPSEYTCDGADVSPPLEWTGVPQGTKAFALISDDPDAPVGTWVHWVVWNIPASSTSLPKSVPANQKLSDGTVQGINDFKKTGFGGPCPPGGTHRYFFKLYALDTPLDLPASSGKKALESAMKGHILDQAEYMGKYARKR